MDHDNVEEPPGAIEAGDAVSVQVGAVGVALTLTVTEQVSVLPSELVTVPVYVVVVEGETAFVPVPGF